MTRLLLRPRDVLADMFVDRTDAGRQLADRLAAEGIDPEVVVAIPRGGLPVGRAVADRFDVPLDVVVAEKVGAPGNPELAVGAVAGDGSRWLNESLAARVGADEEYLDEEAAREAANAREKVDRYRGGDPAPDLAGKAVVLVDDGVATGATAIACLRQVRAAGASTVVLAMPVTSRDALERLRGEADRVVAVETPRDFGAVGRFYRDFEQVTDEEALSYLNRG